MTLSDERYRALTTMRVLALHLASKPKHNKEEAKEIHRLALCALRHYPGNAELQCIAEKAPEWLSARR